MGIAVVALGGNALTTKKEKGSYNELIKNINKSCSCVANLAKNNKLVVVSGSGPQIGAILLQNELAKNRVPTMPLDVLDAELEGELGYLIQQTLRNILAKKNIRKSVVAILTQVLVNKKDNAFKNPTKFVGPFYSLSQVKKLKKEFVIKKDSNRGYRRVVPSPMPLKIIEGSVIKKLVKDNIVIAAGGGGIPVYKKDNILHGVEAVIDKDLASYVLARDIGADYLFILTGVDKVYLSYGKKNQKGLNKVKLKDLKRYYKEGHFPAGSMGPKIEAAIKFLDHNGKKVIITKPELLEKAIKGKAGTSISK